MHDDNDNSTNTVKSLFARDFILSFFALFAFLSANHFLTPTLPVYLKALGSGEREIGVLAGILGIASLTSRLFVGRALLKYRDKSVMMVGALLAAISFLSYVVLRPFWPLLLMRFIQGVAFACLDTAAIACVIGIVPLVYRARAIGYFMLAPSLAMAVAAPAGMFLANSYGFTVLFFSCATVAVFTFLLSWRIKGQDASPVDAASTTPRTSFIDRKIVIPAVTCFLQAFVWGAIAAFFPLYSIQCGVMNPGLFFSASATMIIAARIFGGRILDYRGKEEIILVSICVSMAALAVLSFSCTLPMFIVAGLLWGVGCAFFFPAAMAYALDHAGSSGGTSVGTYQSFMDLGMALGPGIAGAVLPLAGYRLMFLGLAFACLANLAYFYFFVRGRSKRVKTE